MTLWDANYNEVKPDRWNSPCYMCSATGSVLRTESTSCGCFTRCSQFCDRRSTTTVTRECSTCNGTGIKT